MTLSRRRFLQLTTAGLVAGQAGCTGSAISDVADVSTLLDSYIDTLIPADSAPGAVELGVPSQVRALLQRKRALHAAYSLGLAWLDQRAHRLHGAGFADCMLVERDALVQRLSEQDDANLERFLHKSLHHARMFYYSNPRAWPALGITGAPQPLGFMDFTQPHRGHG